MADPLANPLIIGDATARNNTNKIYVTRDMEAALVMTLDTAGEVYCTDGLSSRAVRRRMLVSAGSLVDIDLSMIMYCRSQSCTGRLLVAVDHAILFLASGYGSRGIN